MLPAAMLTAYRVARSARGPLDPPVRTGPPDASWSRYDIDGRTVYLAQTGECAYAEVLAYAKRRLGQRDPLLADAAAVGMTVRQFIDAVGAEWAERQHMGIGHLPSSWRAERLLYQVQLPTTGWWVEIEHPDSLASLEAALEPDLAALGLSGLTVAALRGDDRRVTTTVARWVHAALLDSGEPPIGIAYASKHGTGRCWAYWSRAELRSRLSSDNGSPLTVDDEDLDRVAKRFRLRIW